MRHSKLIRLFVNFILLAGAAAIGIWTCSSPERIGSSFAKTSYYLLFLLFSLWIFALIQWLLEQNFRWRSFLSSYGSGLLLSLFLTLLLFAFVPTELRVLNDEVDIVSVSRSMALERRVDTVAEARRVNDELVPYIRSIIAPSARWD